MLGVYICVYIGKLFCLIQYSLVQEFHLTGIAFNMATLGGSGGNTTTAEAARTVYKNPAVRARLVDLCPEQFKTAYAQILFNSEYILNIYIFF